MYTGRSCWLCGRNGTAEPLDKHHIFGGAYRKKSEKYGLREFGRNYLDEEDLQPTEEKPTGTFQILDEELCVNW